ncbi:cbb3-type cytochrome oxidase assembly protein CcoS [Pseudomonas saliphila]|uniref:cbb3-type cytochrome oxidase assembly protein CcoS n=1 Tax=Pseudomonas saliphila TaxID=2586906 RepID=UPI00123BE738|nr:cbb3-type cytochrome oxidase assembly protein CcoS [Pseudomonas saliphila]
MTVLYIIVPVAVVLVIVAIWVFNWAVNSGQYDDLDSPAHSILFDEEDPAHLAAQKKTSTKEDAAPPESADPEHKS